MRALQDIRKIIKLKILFSKKINAHCTSYNSYKFAGLGCTWCEAMLGCHFSFSLHRHNCRCWAAPSAPWLQVLKMAWVMWGIRFPNYVWVRCKWGRVGAGHAGHVTLVTLVTFLVTQSRSELVIFTWPMHSCVNDLYLHILCDGQDSEFWVITCNSQAPGVWPVSSPGPHLNCQHHKLTRHQL